MKIDSVQCRFESKDECYRMAPQVFKDCFQVEFIHDDLLEVNNDVAKDARIKQIRIKDPKILNQILDVLLDNDQIVAVDDSYDVNYQKISSDGRLGFSLHINKHVVDFVLEILSIASQDFSLASVLLTGGGMLIKIFLDSIHINKGLKRCVALEIANISGKDNKQFSLDDLATIFEERILDNQECPYDKVCKKRTEADVCFLNEKNFKLEIDCVLKELEKCGIIVYRNGFYTVAPTVSSK